MDVLNGLVDGEHVAAGENVLFLNGRDGVVYKSFAPVSYTELPLTHGTVLVVTAGRQHANSVYVFVASGALRSLVPASGTTALRSEVVASDAGVTSLVGPSGVAHLKYLRAESSWFFGREHQLGRRPGMSLRSVDEDRGVECAADAGPPLHSIIRVDDVASSDQQLLIDAIDHMNPPGWPLGSVQTMPGLLYLACTDPSHNGTANIRVLGIPCEPVTFDLECTLCALAVAETDVPDDLPIAVTVTMPNAARDGTTAVNGTLHVPGFLLRGDRFVQRTVVVWDTGARPVVADTRVGANRVRHVIWG